MIQPLQCYYGNILLSWQLSHSKEIFMKLVMGCLTDNEVCLYLCRNEEEVTRGLKKIREHLGEGGLLTTAVWEITEGFVPEGFRLDGVMG